MLKKDFQGTEADVLSMQKVIEQGNLNRKKRDAENTGHRFAEFIFAKSPETNIAFSRHAA